MSIPAALCLSCRRFPTGSRPVVETSVDGGNGRALAGGTLRKRPLDHYVRERVESTRHQGVGVRPVVKPALRRLWRDSTTLQIGVHPASAVVVGGISEQTARLVAAFDGAHDAPALRLRARALGLEESVVDRLVSMLGDAAVLDDAAIDAAPLAALSRIERDRLAPDLASMSLLSGRLDGGMSTVSGRQRASVGIIGGGRVGGAIASLLAASGIGHVMVDDPSTRRRADLPTAAQPVLRCPTPGRPERKPPMPPCIASARAPALLRYSSRAPTTSWCWRPQDRSIRLSPMTWCDRESRTSTSSCAKRPQSSALSCCPGRHRACAVSICIAATATLRGRSLPRSWRSTVYAPASRRAT
jgi:hypothetical protein